MKTCFKTFETLTEYALFCEEHVNRESAATSEDSWAGGSFNEAVALACRGWQEGANQSAAIASRLGDVAASRLLQHEPFYDVSGLELDVGAYTSGRPECWLDTAPTLAPAKGQVVSIVMSACVSGSMHPARLIERGIRVAALISALEASGRSVELWVKDYGKSNGSGSNAVVIGASVCIKRPGQPLDLGVVSYACAHPSMLRRLGFAFRDYAVKQGVKGIECSNGYGRVADPETADQGDIFIPSIETGKGQTEAETLEWIKTTLTNQGIETN